MEMPLTGLLTWTSILSLCSFVFLAVLLKKKEKALVLARQGLMEWKKKAESLEGKLRQASNRIERQRVQIKNLEGSNHELKERDLSLFRGQFADSLRLLRDKSLSLSQDRLKEVLSAEVDIILKKIYGGPDGLGELVSCINKYFDNVLEHLQDEIPGLTNVDFKIFCYYCIGFPPEQIYQLVGLNDISTLYLRKKRLSDKISVLNSERRELYLVLLDSSRAKKHNGRKICPY